MSLSQYKPMGRVGKDQWKFDRRPKPRPKIRFYFVCFLPFPFPLQLPCESASLSPWIPGGAFAIDQKIIRPLLKLCVIILQHFTSWRLALKTARSWGPVVSANSNLYVCCWIQDLGRLWKTLEIWWSVWASLLMNWSDTSAQNEFVCWMFLAAICSGWVDSLSHAPMSTTPASTSLAASSSTIARRSPTVIGSSWTSTSSHSPSTSLTMTSSWREWWCSISLTLTSSASYRSSQTLPRSSVPSSYLRRLSPLSLTTEKWTSTIPYGLNRWTWKLNHSDLNRLCACSETDHHTSWDYGDYRWRW